MCRRPSLCGHYGVIQTNQGVQVRDAQLPHRFSQRHVKQVLRRKPGPALGFWQKAATSPVALDGWIYVGHPTSF